MSEPDTFEQWMERAAQLERQVEEEELVGDLAEANFTEAARAYEIAHSRDAHNADCLCNWGRVLLVLSNFIHDDDDDDDNDRDGGNNKEAGRGEGEDNARRLNHVLVAIDKFEQAVELQPSNIHAIFSLAQALATQYDLTDEDEIDRASSEALLKRAIALFEQVYKLQEKQIESGERVDEDDAITNDDLADTSAAAAECVTSLACLQEDMTEADRLFSDACDRLKKALTLAESRRADILGDWASVLEAQANHRQTVANRMDATLYEPAISMHRDAIKADPTCSDSYCNLGDLYLSIAHGKLVEATLEADIEEDTPNSGENGRRLAEERIAAMDGDIRPYYDLACEQFKNAVNVDPENIAVHQKLGDIYFALSRLLLGSARADEQTLLAESESWYRRGLNSLGDEDDEDLVIRLAQVLDCQGREEESKEQMERWRTLGGQVKDLHQEDDVFEKDFTNRVARHLATA